MGRNIVVGKLGQKLVFNRKSAEAKRSNTNGNVGAYLFYKLLFENNPHDRFFVIGDNDLKSFDKPPFANVVDASRWDLAFQLQIKADYAIILIGLLEEDNPGEQLLKYLNVSNTKWLLVADDPRCLNTKAMDITNMPRKIISQFSGDFYFCCKKYFVEYVPIETASCYGANDAGKIGNKTRDFVVVANTAGDYDRLGIVGRLTRSIPEVEVYGRVRGSRWEKDSRFKGEVEFTEMQNILQQAKTTLLVPIKPGWVTSKYIEAIMCGTLPIFHADYGVELLKHVPGFLVVRDEGELKSVYRAVMDDPGYIRYMLAKLNSRLVKPFVDGSKLSAKVLSICKTL